MQIEKIESANLVLVFMLQNELMSVERAVERWKRFIFLIFSFKIKGGFMNAVLFPNIIRVCWDFVTEDRLVSV